MKEMDGMPVKRYKSIFSISNSNFFSVVLNSKHIDCSVCDKACIPCIKLNMLFYWFSASKNNIKKNNKIVQKRLQTKILHRIFLEPTHFVHLTNALSLSCRAIRCVEESWISWIWIVCHIFNHRLPSNLENLFVQWKWRWKWT